MQHPAIRMREVTKVIKKSIKICNIFCNPKFVHEIELIILMLFEEFSPIRFFSFEISQQKMCSEQI